MSPSALELGALADLRLALTQRGRSCEIVGYPEADGDDPMTVDARFEIDGVVWAVEHTRVMPDDSMVPAQREAEKALLPKLDALAVEHGVRLTVAIFAPRWTEGNKAEAEAVYREVLDAARRAGATRKSDLNHRLTTASRFTLWLARGLRRI
jgi:hypothetical protein